MSPRGTRRQAISFASLAAESLCTTLARYEIRFSKGPMVAAACLAASIADGLLALVRVLDSRGQGHAPALARQLIDSVLELEMICVDPKTIFALWLATAQDKVELGEQLLMQVKDLPYDLRAAVTTEIAEQARVVSSLARRGVERMGAQEKLGIAQASTALWTFYWRYLSSAHNDLRVLEHRRLRGQRLVLGEHLSDDDVREVVTIYASVALRVYELAPRFMKVTDEELRPQWEPLVPGLHQIAQDPPTRRR